MRFRGDDRRFGHGAGIAEVALGYDEGAGVDALRVDPRGAESGGHDD